MIQYQLQYKELMKYYLTSLGCQFWKFKHASLVCAMLVIGKNTVFFESHLLVSISEFVIHKIMKQVDFVKRDKIQIQEVSFARIPVIKI